MKRLAVLAGAALALTAGALLFWPEQVPPRPNRIDEALAVLTESGDPTLQLEAEDYLIKASLDESAVVGAVRDSLLAAQTEHSKTAHVRVLAGIWIESGSEGAHQALLGLLSDDSLALAAALNLAKGGDAAGAGVLREVATSGIGADAQEAQWWLGELGLDE